MCIKTKEKNTTDIQGIFKERRTCFKEKRKMVTGDEDESAWDEEDEKEGKERSRLT